MKRNIFAVLLVLTFAGTIVLLDSEHAYPSKLFTSDFMLGESCGSFSNAGSTPFFILQPGYQLVLDGTKRRNTYETTIEVLGDTKTVTLDLNGVSTPVVTRVVQVTETKNGVLAAVIKDYVAICDNTSSIILFGRDVSIYDSTGATIVSTDGSWLAGVNGATPGIILPGTVLLGGRYFQVEAPGERQEKEEIISMTDDVVTPSGTFTDCLRINETTTPPTGTRVKFYAAGVGLVKDGFLVLTGLNAAEINVAQGATNIPDVTGSYAFATSGPVTFTIKNTGVKTLILNGSPAVQISGTNAADFVVTTQPAPSVAAGASATFVITFTPGGPGTRTATVVIPNNDPNEAPYTFTVNGSGPVPVINVAQGGTNIPDNTGSYNFNNSTAAVTFTITNTGTAPLILTGSPAIQLTGPNAAQFEVTTQPAATVAAGGSTTFVITPNPQGAAALKRATVWIQNNEADRNPYNFDIQGTF